MRFHTEGGGRGGGGGGCVPHPEAAANALGTPAGPWPALRRSPIHPRGPAPPARTPTAHRMALARWRAALEGWLRGGRRAWMLAAAAAEASSAPPCGGRTHDPTPCAVCEHSPSNNSSQHGGMNQPGLSGLSEGRFRGLTTVRSQQLIPATLIPLLRRSELSLSRTSRAHAHQFHVFALIHKAQVLT